MCLLCSERKSKLEKENQKTKQMWKRPNEHLEMRNVIIAIKTPLGPGQAAQLVRA